MPVRKTPCKFGKKREPVLRVKEWIDMNYEHWRCYGRDKKRSDHIFKALKSAHVNFLVKLGKKTPNVMFLGPGKGYSVLEFKNYLSKSKINPIIDVFSLTRDLWPEVENIIHKDLSQNIPFENLNVKNSKFKSLENKYDLVVGAMSVGVHTKYPVNSLFTSALMLKKGGRAYIEFIDFLKKNPKASTIKELKKDLELNKYFYFSKYRTYIPQYQKQISVFKKVFLRMIKAYNPELEFSIKMLDNNLNHFTAQMNFIEIKRIK